ncbi:2-oxoglutarate and iron-dependent oxygenase domain-containing protein 2 isoform X2 [Aplysia californica]|uniref:2-oxoglutarate and iron-dependent oxygenase domain-containing protein 2 isoform X2 n=1 Tax=Aplysia californica TaxID=6500 RepID=A0ABM0JEE6_APLCA|nr:2-oxoglutarate and iron-dependent oxygenase domain-containing protein 2 isoform X2 [Aplysia californica]
MLLKGGQEYICSCFFKRNIFLKRYKMHVTFESQDQFQDQYRQLLRMKGCATEKQYKDVLEQITSEIERRRALHKLTADRTQRFKDTYIKLHPDIWILKEPFLDSRFFSIVADAQSKSLDNLLFSILDNSGNITDMCKLLIEEIENFESSPHAKTRPNTMNEYGVSLDEMGLSQGLILPLIQKYLLPICASLFPSWGGGTIDSFKAFSVKYEMGNDLQLATHYDNAEVTININLGDKYEGGNLQFGRIFGDEEEYEGKGEESYTCDHKKGHGILHCGRRMHSALPITQGMRTNLVIWMRSSTVRNTQCPMCLSHPSLHEVPAEGEGFTIQSPWSCSCT